ncbi:MAG: nicotinate-nucleotide adenylyltransferase [Lachnospiraceae bacterium]|nr:nicotinate-nucleotide adenylyltransferase [Lachnospiraceae bacterium]
MRKIGILGGTFNPIHNGHLAIGKAALRRLKLDEVLFMPACIPPHKQNVPMTAGDLRAEMVEAAIADEPSFSCSRLELEKEGVSYTADTLRILTKEYGRGVRLYLLVGSDSLCYMEHWYEPEVIFSLAHIGVYYRTVNDYTFVRDHAAMLRARFNAKITIFRKDDTVDISSTELREALTDPNSKKALEYLPGPVLNIIREKGLYKSAVAQD